MPSFEVHHGDMLNDIDWSNADLVFANSTCFDQTLLTKISEKASKCKKGTWLFSLTKKIPTAEDFSENKEWECVMSIKREMSWGLATIHIQRKLK